MSQLFKLIHAVARLGMSCNDTLRLSPSCSEHVDERCMNYLQVSYYYHLVLCRFVQSYYGVDMYYLTTVSVCTILLLSRYCDRYVLSYYYVSMYCDTTILLQCRSLSKSRRSVEPSESTLVDRQSAVRSPWPAPGLALPYASLLNLGRTLVPWCGNTSSRTTQ